MMPREFTDNARAKIQELLDQGLIEPKDAVIKIRGLRFTPGLLDNITKSNYKLSFLNPGAMTNIHEISQIGGSADKVMGDKENLGMGGRTSSLNYSDVMYITRKDGISHMIVLGFRGTGSQQTVKVVVPVSEVTTWVEQNVKERTYPDGDFTEVVLLGKDGEPTQNTVRNPFNDTKDVSKGYYTKKLHHRFVDVSIPIIFQKAKTEDGDTFGSGTQSAKHGRYFKTFHDGFVEAKKNFPNSGSFLEVRSNLKNPNSGMKIHYYYIGTKLNSKGDEEPVTNSTLSSMTTVATNGLIWKAANGVKEYFDVAEGSTKKVRDQQLGIVGGNDHFRIFVELPTSDYQPNDARNGLRCDATNDPIVFDDLLEDIVASMSSTYKQMITKHSVTQSNKNLDSELRKRVLAFQNLTKLAKMSSGASNSSSTGNQPGGTKKGKSGSSNSNKKKYKHNNALKVHSQNNRTTMSNIELINFKHVGDAEVGPFIARLIESKVKGDRDELLFNTEHHLIDSIIAELNVKPIVGLHIRPSVYNELKLKLAVHCIINKSLRDDSKYQYSHNDYKDSVKDPSLLARAVDYMDLLPRLRTIATKLAQQERAGTLPDNPEEFVEEAELTGVDDQTEQRWTKAGVEMPAKEILPCTKEVNFE